MNSNNITEKKIKDILVQPTAIRTGVYEKPQEKGDIIYIQAKQFDNWGNTIAEPEAFLSADKKTEGHLLSDGEVLMTAKGFRFFATPYHKELGPAIASSLFFVLTPDQTIIHPDYLAMYLNLPSSTEKFKELSAGSSIPSIRKGELAEIAIKLPPLEEQKKIVALAELHRREVKLMEDLLEAKKSLYTQIVSTLLK